MNTNITRDVQAGGAHLVEIHWRWLLLWWIRAEQEKAVEGEKQKQKKN